MSLRSDRSSQTSSRSYTTWINLAAEDSDRPVTSEDELRVRTESSTSTTVLARSPSDSITADMTSAAASTGEIRADMSPVGGVLDATLCPKHGIKGTEDDAAHALVIMSEGREVGRVGGEQEGKVIADMKTEDVLAAKDSAGLLKGNVLANLCAIAEAVEKKLGSTESCGSPTPANKRNTGSGSAFSREEVSMGCLYRADDEHDSSSSSSSLSHLDFIGNTRGDSETDHEAKSSERTPPRSSSQPLTNTIGTDDNESVSATMMAEDATSYPMISEPSPPSSTSHSSHNSTPSMIDSSTVPRLDVQGVDLRASEASVESDGNTIGGAGWGLFCSSPEKRGETVFEEKALLTVSRSSVDDADWRVVLAAAKKVLLKLLKYEVCGC